jgi:hypothetical protein
METALLVLAIILLLGVLGVQYVLYTSVNRVARALGLRPPGAHGVSEEEEPDTDAPSVEPSFEDRAAFEPEVDPGASGVGAEFALGSTATPAAAAAEPSYDAPETDYPAAASRGWGSEEPPSGSGLRGAVIDDGGVVAAEETWSASEPESSAAASVADSSFVSDDEAVAAAQASVEPAQAAGVSQRPIEDEPEEQPFERDGRWWFKRGDELLVYDEVEGQWQPVAGATAPAPTPAVITNPTSAEAGAINAELASLSGDAPSVYRGAETTESPAATEPEPALGSPAATPVVESAAPDATSEMATVDTSDADKPASGASEEPVQPVQEWKSGSFWKCPSCGAVNGSTATSCRMCFAARA